MQTLKDVQPSVERFLDEAETCARQRCGSACLLTLFPVMLGIAEALAPGQDTNAALLVEFLKHMPSPFLWLITPVSVNPCPRLVGQKLADIRDSLAHQISLPDDVRLADSRARAECWSKKDPDRYIISTYDLTRAVRETAIEIIRSEPNCVFDPRPRIKNRGVAKVELDRDSPEAHRSTASQSVIVTRAVEDRGHEKGTD